MQWDSWMLDSNICSYMFCKGYLTSPRTTPRAFSSNDNLYLCTIYCWFLGASRVSYIAPTSCLPAINSASISSKRFRTQWHKYEHARAHWKVIKGLKARFGCCCCSIVMWVSISQSFSWKRSQNPVRCKRHMCLNSRRWLTFIREWFAFMFVVLLNACLDGLFASL